MAIDYFPLEINVSQIVGSAVKRARLLIATNLPEGTPLAYGDEIALPGGIYTLPGGVGEVTLPTQTGVTNLDGDTLQYIVTGEYSVDGAVKLLDPIYIDAPTTTTAVNLASFVGVTSVPATFMGAAVAQLQAKVDEAEAIKQYVTDVSNIDTTVSAVDFALGQPGPAATLYAAIGQALEETPIVTAAAAAAAETAVAAAVKSPRTSYNLFNPADSDVQVGYILGGNAGVATALAGYTTTGWIPVTPGQQVSVSAHRYIAYVKADKTTAAATAVNTGNPAATATYTIPAETAFIRVSFQSSVFPTLMVNVGATLKTYEAYGTIYEIDQGFAAAVGAAIPPPPAGSVAVTKTGAALALTTSKGGKMLTQAATLVNGVFNKGFGLLGVTYDGASVHPQVDETTPIRTQLSTLAGAHGYIHVRRFTNPDAKTIADLGSKWSYSGGPVMTLVDIDTSGRLYLAYPYTVDGNGVVQVATPTITTDLTHVSGATKTGTIAVSTMEAGYQLYPAVARQQGHLYVDGKRRDADGTYTGDLVEVRVTYDVLDYKSLIDTAQANIGVPIASRTIAGSVRVEEVWRWTGEGVCLVPTRYSELSPTTLGVCGGLQSDPLAKAGATTKRYLPGVGAAGGVNWTDGVALAAYASTTVITSADLLKPGQPPLFHLDVLEQGGSVVLGFAMGYLPYGTRGDEASTSASRISRAATNLWDMRNTKKSYPAFTTSETAGWGSKSVIGFRVYLTPAQVETVLASKGSAAGAFAALDAAVGLTR